LRDGRPALGTIQAAVRFGKGWGGEESINKRLILWIPPHGNGQHPNGSPMRGIVDRPHGSEAHVLL
jgi:hypothetical protein